jgi:hypothetical protein
MWAVPTIAAELLAWKLVAMVAAAEVAMAAETVQVEAMAAAGRLVERLLREL